MMSCSTTPPLRNATNIIRSGSSPTLLGAEVWWSENQNRVWNFYICFNLWGPWGVQIARRGDHHCTQETISSGWVCNRNNCYWTLWFNIDSRSLVATLCYHSSAYVDGFIRCLFWFLYFVLFFWILMVFGCLVVSLSLSVYSLCPLVVHLSLFGFYYLIFWLILDWYCHYVKTLVSRSRRWRYTANSH